MVKNNGRNGSGNGRPPASGAREWEHPGNPRIRVTDNSDYFVKLIKMDAHDGVVLVPSEDLRRDLGSKMKSAFQSLHHASEPPNTFTAQVSYNQAANELDVKGLLPPHLQIVQKDIEHLLVLFSLSVQPKSTLYIAEDTADLFPQQGRAVPVMMMHFVTAGNGAMTDDQNALIQPGHIGYFTPEVEFPLHPYNRNNSSVTFAVIPTR